MEIKGFLIISGKQFMTLQSHRIYYINLNDEKYLKYIDGCHVSEPVNLTYKDIKLVWNVKMNGGFSNAQICYIPFYFDKNIPQATLDTLNYDKYEDILEMEKLYDNKEYFLQDFKDRLKNMGVTNTFFKDLEKI